MGCERFICLFFCRLRSSDKPFVGYYDAEMKNGKEAIITDRKPEGVHVALSSSLSGYVFKVKTFPD